MNKSPTYKVLCELLGISAKRKQRKRAARNPSKGSEVIDAAISAIEVALEKREIDSAAAEEYIKEAKQDSKNAREILDWLIDQKGL